MYRLIYVKRKYNKLNQILNNKKMRLKIDQRKMKRKLIQNKLNNVIVKIIKQSTSSKKINIETGSSNLWKNRYVFFLYYQTIARKC